MAVITYNPTKFLEPLLTNGLDYMIANVPASPTYEDIIDTSVAYLSSIFPSMPGDSVDLIKTAMATGANDYINNKIAQQLNFNVNGMVLVRSVVVGIKTNPIDSLDSFFALAEEQIALNNLNTVSKPALYGGITLARTSNVYWSSVVNTPGGWSVYINSNAAINYANIPFWVGATYISALAGYAALQEPMVSGANIDNEKGRIYGLYGAMMVALSITSAQVILKWANRPRLIYPPKGPVLR